MLVLLNVMRLRNASGRIASAPSLRELVETLTRIRRAGGLGIRVDTCTAALS